MTAAVDHHDHQHETNTKVVMGFWVFILSDFVLFAVLFASYAVLHNNTYGGIGIQQIVTLPYVLIESLLLLAGSFTFGLSAIASNCGKKGWVWFWLLVTCLLGLGFVCMEYHQLAYLVHEGQSWQQSAFLSAFFGLVGVHGIHVLVALVWGLVLLVQFIYKPLNEMRTRLSCFGLFWHFLNIIWVFIFTVVYLMGVL